MSTSVVDIPVCPSAPQVLSGLGLEDFAGLPLQTTPLAAGGRCDLLDAFYVTVSAVRAVLLLPSAPVVGVAFSRGRRY
jgi:hypothetical protein